MESVDDSMGHDEMVGLRRLSQISRLYSGPKRWPLGVLAPNSVDLADYADTKVSCFIRSMLSLFPEPTANRKLQRTCTDKKLNQIFLIGKEI